MSMPRISNEEFVECYPSETFNFVISKLEDGTWKGLFFHHNHTHVFQDNISPDHLRLSMMNYGQQNA